MPNDDYLKRLNETGTRANRIALLWSIALVLVYYTGLGPVIVPLAELRASREQEERYRTNLKVVSQTRENIGSKGAVQQASKERDIRYELKEQEQETKRKEQKAKTVNFELPGYKVPIPTIYAPLVWTALLSGLVWYLALARSTMLSLCAKALRRITTAAPHSTEGIPTPPAEEPVGMFSGVPCWIAPLPSINSPYVVRASDLRNAFGPSYTYDGAKIVTVLIALILGAIQLHCAWISLVMYEELGDGWEKWLLPILVFLISGLTAFQVWLWFKPQTVPDNYANETDPNKFTRRQVLHVLGIVSVSVVAFPIIKHLQILDPWKTQRYPKRRRSSSVVAEDLNQDFYNNPKSQIIHYVSYDKRILDIKNINKERLAQHMVKEPLLELNFKNKNQRVHLSTSSHSFEQAAMLSMRQKEYKKACQLLLYGIKHDLLFKIGIGRPPSFRLYDLLAGITVRFENEVGKQYFEELMQAIRTAEQKTAHTDKEKQVFAFRINK
jgi:hypothetical protein